MAFRVPCAASLSVFLSLRVLFPSSLSPTHPFSPSSFHPHTSSSSHSISPLPQLSYAYSCLGRLRSLREKTTIINILVSPPLALQRRSHMTFCRHTGDVFCSMVALILVAYKRFFRHTGEQILFYRRLILVVHMKHFAVTVAHLNVEIFQRWK